MPPVPKEVTRLVSLFRENYTDYTKSSFNETQLRRQFLDPFFESLGWDIANIAGYSESYKDVVHEDHLNDEGQRKAPDYSFRIGRERKFFLEAKKPSINISKDKLSTYQLRRYAWSAGLPLSIISNFCELSIYDTRIRPERDDSPRIALLLNYRFEDFESKWDEIAGIISKPAVLKGSFDRFADKKLKKGNTKVDEAFLDTIESFRLNLAKSIKRHNQEISILELSHIVQSTIDRILFLRICEDKGIEKYGLLKKVIGSNSSTELTKIFKDAQKRYNSDLFHLFAESRSDHYFDKSYGSIEIPSSIVNSIINTLYYPQSPYEFSVISPEILGAVYERFLGSVISESGKTIKVELKEDLKKAGGVYYTPLNIVKYMSAASIDALMAQQIKDFPTVKILDMACGSGSFLIQLYDDLLHRYREWHIKRGKKSSRYLVRVPGTQGKVESLHLTLEERKRILLDHIFGVDIDAQAVEVTKLSLFLKLIEDSDVLPRQLELSPFQSRILPDLSKNILCGNSIVSNDALETINMSEKEVISYKPFNWNSHENFRHILSDGGFDLIIGNPPYSYRNSTIDLFKDYYKNRYKSTQGNFDVYKMFLEAAIKLLRPGGTVCQIVNSSFLIQPQFKLLRVILDESLRIDEISVLGPNVFHGVTIDTVILRAAKRGRGIKSGHIQVKEPELPALVASAPVHYVTQSRFSTSPSRAFEWRLDDVLFEIVNNIFNRYPSLESKYEISVGINTGYIKSEMISETRTNSKFHPCVPGTGISRYGSVNTKGFILYDAAYIRAAGARGRSLPPERFFSSEKILVVRTRNTSLKRRIVATLDTQRNYHLNRLSSIISRDNSDLYTLLGILSSAFMNFIFLTRYFNYEVKPVYLSKIPIATTYDRVVSDLVKTRMDLESKLISAQTDAHRRALRMNIFEIERRIDERIYALYRVDAKQIAAFEKVVDALPGSF